MSDDELDLSETSRITHVVIRKVHDVDHVDSSRTIRMAVGPPNEISRTASHWLCHQVTPHVCTFPIFLFWKKPRYTAHYLSICKGGANEVFLTLECMRTILSCATALRTQPFAYLYTSLP